MSKKKPVKKKKKPNFYVIISIKLLIIAFILYGIYFTQNSYENTISLLAINEVESGMAVGGSVIKLNLEIKPGDGNIYTSLDTLEELDTQISIINSQKIACDLFSLDCDEYDFYYDFQGSALVLKGPSASSAIAILTAKTMMKEKIKNDVVITGSLNSGGIIGNVGGIDTKIEVAQRLGFEKVLIPVFSEYNETEKRDIEVVKVIDIIEAYNNFENLRDYQLDTYSLDDENYNEYMKSLANSLCNRSNYIKERVLLDEIDENHTLYNVKKAATDSYDSSLIAESNENFYSQGSFCYNANINYRIIYEQQKNLSLEEINSEIKRLKDQIQKKIILVNSQEYKRDINTINDFYVYLILIDRLEEAREYAQIAEETNLNINNASNLNSTQNITNTTTTNLFVQVENIKTQKENLYAYSIERFYTVELWERLIKHSGTRILFNERTIDEACLKINRDISIKSELLQNYGITIFNEEIKKQLDLNNPFENKYLCIYTGLELSARMNTILNSVGIDESNQKNYTQKLIDITESRLALNSNGDFPLIPYIYYEYSKNLFEQDDFSSSMLYSNYALTYTDLNIYLEKEKIDKSYLNSVIEELFSGDFKTLIFIAALMVLLIFS